MMEPVRRFLMRVCIEPRLLPGVRWSTLKMVKSWPSCWITMPGRSCVALTLLIVLCDPDWAGIDGSLESSLISEIPEGWRLPLHCSRNDSRHTGMKIKPSANVQYKGHDSRRSILDFSIMSSLFRNVCQASLE